MTPMPVNEGEEADLRYITHNNGFDHTAQHYLISQYLLSAIEANRSVTSLTDRELRNLLSDVKPHRSKWANEEKVGQEELYEACEKVLLDLKNYTEHSTPFLNKVNKREAPDYFEVITKPMDLGTVTKKLRSFQYKSKKEFEADLYLIYENCLTYNTNPLSEYRKHAYAMKRKTAALLLQVPEIVIRDRAELEAEEEAEAESDEGEAAEDQQVSRKAPGSNKHLSAATAAAQSDGQDGRARESSAAPSVDGISNGTAAAEPAAAANGASVAPGTPMQTSPHNGAAVAEPMDGVVMAESSGIDLEQEEKDVSAEIDADTGDVQFEAWKEMTKRARAKICAEREKQFRLPFSDREAIQRTPSDMRRFALLETAHDSPTLWRDPVSRAGGREGVTSPGGDRNRQAAALYDDEDDDDDDRRRKDEGMFLPEYVVTSGMSELWDTFLEREEEAGGKARSEGGEGAGVFSEARKRLFEVGEGEEGEEGGETGFWASRIDMAAYPEAVFPNHGVAEKVEKNIEELKAIREVYNKCQMQRGVMETKSAPPAPTLDRTRSLPPPAPRLAPGPPDELPPLVMNEDAGLDLLGRVVARMLAHAGFEGAHATAANVVTEVAVDYMLNLGRSLRVYMDNYNKGMTPEEIILHTLYENGVNNIGELESYVRDEIERYGTKLGDIHRRLDATYNEIINGPAEGHVVDDDALFAEEDVFASGSFGEDLGEDFFGFKELGLDKEFGLESLAITSRDLSHILHLLIVDRMLKRVPKEKPLQYPPPPQFTPITDADSQIGLLRPSFAKKLEETNGNLVEDEFMVNKFRSRPRLPPSGKLNPTGRKRPIKEDLNELKKKKRKKAMEQLQAERAEKKKQKAEAKAAKVAEKEQKKRQKEEIKEKERLMKLEARKEKAAANKKDKASSSAATEAPTTEGSSPAGNESEEPAPSPSSSRIMENEPSPPPDEVEVVPKKKKKKGKDKEE
ncbi:LOW QUALITY PROTEIN: hypothetical protein BC937DRAFT_89120 [Endogone sp. FLAS-F59071]|nr:LOW QUALITY PROTEIN: hypothetical protein BC937DRAFT_89120 [Endogone sp. FLAS-F59071]|eukprot:RUS22446.1 LOW QUALITY PROTEIN: hypothetical protein BC937DRAFT_89120 [Endogone sp. FLAS-F59071]